MPDPIQLPEGVERWWAGPQKHRDSTGSFVAVSDLPAIIAQEREKWEAEADDRYEFCDSCERPARGGDLKLVTVRVAEGDAEPIRLCAVCRTEIERNQAKANLVEQEARNQSLKDELLVIFDQAKAQALAELREAFKRALRDPGWEFGRDVIRNSLACFDDALSTLEQEGEE